MVNYPIRVEDADLKKLRDLAAKKALRDGTPIHGSIVREARHAIKNQITALETDLQKENHTSKS